MVVATQDIVGGVQVLLWYSVQIGLYLSEVTGRSVLVPRFNTVRFLPHERFLLSAGRPQAFVSCFAPRM